MLHIGGGYMVPTHAVVAILNLDHATPAQAAFLKSAARTGKQVNICAAPKSAVVCDSRWGEWVYMSPISSLTLARRTLARDDPDRHPPSRAPLC